MLTALLLHLEDSKLSYLSDQKLPTSPFMLYGSLHCPSNCIPRILHLYFALIINIVKLIYLALMGDYTVDLGSYRVTPLCRVYGSTR